jgi:nucleoid-associated protein YgaU
METQPALQEVKPEDKGEARAPELPQVGSPPTSKATEPDRAAPSAETPARPASPNPGLVAPGLDAVRAERDAVGETHKPNILKEEDLKPGHEGPSIGSPGAMSESVTTGRPEVIDSRASGNLPSRDKESVTIPAKPDKPAAPNAVSPASEPAASKSPEIPARDEAIGGKPGSSASELSTSTAQPARDLAEAGWVRIPNKGRIPSDMGGDPDASGVANRRGSDRAIDRRGQADTSLGFALGSSATRPADANDRAIAGSAPPSTGLGTAVRSIRPSGGSRTDAGSSRVEPTLHVVERGENFWTISRLYYGSGRRYYRALWKANFQKYPNINEIHINDIIQIPAVEDLDPAYIERPQRRPVAGRDEDPTRDLADGSDATAGMERLNSFPTTRTARTSDAGDGIPVRRSGRAAPELELPVGDAGAGRIGHGASADRSDAEEDNGPTTAIRSTARPRSSAPVDRPVYKVRRYDTLRSIARDILGDPHRADEIYDINRDIIDDPALLTTGQLLELPEDADTRRVTIRDRYRGRD